MEKYDTVDEYINSFFGEKKEVLTKFRTFARKKIPQATESMSYGMPTFKLNGKNIVHFAAFKDHVSFFPTPSGIDAFEKETKQYRTGKGTMQFADGNKIPWDLIRKIIDFRIEEIVSKKRR